MTPTPPLIRAARKGAGLTQRQAAALVHSSLRSWAAWEAGEVPMHAGLWELFGLKIGGLGSSEPAPPVPAAS